MCGIVGHVGPNNSVETVLEGLKRLEYRGYDSAGIAFTNREKKLHSFKRVGKISSLIQSMKGKRYSSSATIGHTRWATHGEVSDSNSHPHMAPTMALVHNGIVENYASLKEELLEKGHQFASDTDSEVFLALVLEETKVHPFKEALARAFKAIKGHSAFVILQDNGEIIAVKRGVPLVCSLDLSTPNGQGTISSDPYALVGLGENLYFPEDEVICSLALEQNIPKLNFFELDGQVSTRWSQRLQSVELKISEKGPFEHFMLKEINQQAKLIDELAQYYFAGEGVDVLSSIHHPANTATVHIMACGTAYYAGLMVARYFESFNKISTKVALSSEFRYQEPLLGKEDWGIFISQSGETADTLAALSLCTLKGLSTLSIVNVEGSTLYRNSTHNLPIKAGAEIGVASTKAFSQMVLVGRILSFAWSKNKKEKKQLVEKFNLLARAIQELLEDTSAIKNVAQAIYDYKTVIYTGRGIYYPIAMEGALKLKEISYIHAEGYASGELKHGPIALIDPTVVNVAIVGPELYQKTISNLQEVKARKGIIVTIGPRGDNFLAKMSDFFIPLNFEGLEELSPLLVNVVNQLLAYHIAKLKGTDIDRPRNLAKSVTVE